MPKDKSVLIREYLNKVKSANKELTRKEAFKDLLNRLYVGNAETQSVLKDTTLRTKKTILSIIGKISNILAQIYPKTRSLIID